MQDNAVIHCDTGVANVIEDDVTIGHGAIVHGEIVGAGSLVGMGATLLSRTRVGKNCLIAAGATVPPGLVVPDGMAVMGVPGKIVRPVKEEELKYMRWLSGHYVELVRKYVAQESSSEWANRTRDSTKPDAEAVGDAPGSSNALSRSKNPVRRLRLPHPAW